MSSEDFIGAVLGGHHEDFGRSTPQYIRIWMEEKYVTGFRGIIVDYHCDYLCISEAHACKHPSNIQVYSTHTGYSYKSIFDFTVESDKEFCKATFRCSQKPVQLKLPADQINMLLKMKKEIEIRKQNPSVPVEPEEKEFKGETVK